MHDTTREILLRQPAYSLELSRSWDDGGEAYHVFILYPAVNGNQDGQEEGINLLMGRGHEVSRRDMHYALYLFQRFHLNHANALQTIHG